jgi:glycosyltransferase involved in cell wall biosynthesis
MEAGAAGVPLVLGDMSSEREHFGDYARYVHPADVEGIRAAVERVIAAPEAPAQREARGRRFAADFSIARHADETWALYQRIRAERIGASSATPLVMDLSALLHFVRVRQPFTGVPLAERNILRELALLDRSMRGVVYNDVKGRFIEISFQDLDDFDEHRFNSRYWFASDEHAGVDRKSVLRFADQAASPPPDPDRSFTPRALPFRTRAIALAKQSLQRSPRLLRDPVTSLLQRVRPGFDPFQMPPGYDVTAFRGMPTGAMSAQTRAVHPAEPTGKETVRFAHPLGRLLVHDAPRHRQVVPAGARLLTLGQSWLSNGPLLDELLRLVETRALSLEPYVFDLTYHTGAHQTGWVDNDERFMRLLALLGHSRFVFTESRQIEDELQKLRVSRGFTYRTLRTGLRGREFSVMSRRGGGPRYRPDSFVLVISSFNRRKNHDFLIRVWMNLYETWIAPVAHDFRLVLVGQVQEERKYGDATFVAQLKRSNIDVHADLPDAVLAGLMHDCAITAYPSLREGWGLPAQESLMCGKVCLVSSTLPVAQEIANPALVKIAPDDFYGWHEALKTWLGNAAMRRAFSERAREYSPPTWREIAETILVRAPSS